MSKKKESYFSTIKQSEWGGIDDKMKEIVFHKYFLGDVKNRYGDRWNDDNKNTKRLYDFVSKRKFDEYGNVTDKNVVIVEVYILLKDLVKKKVVEMDIVVE